MKKVVFLIILFVGFFTATFTSWDVACTKIYAPGSLMIAAVATFSFDPLSLEKNENETANYMCPLFAVTGCLLKKIIKR